MHSSDDATREVAFFRSPKTPMASAPPARPEVARARRVVVKLGTRVLTHDDGSLALSRLFAVVEVAGELRRQGRDVLIVTSGAVGLGRDALGLAKTPSELAERQACAAVGQSRLMQLYQEGFAHLGLVCGQVLLTQGDFDDRPRYLNLRRTLATLLARGVVPVINENDAVSTAELAFLEGARQKIFGDNDRLSALVATKLDAELLVLLTDVPGLFDRDPRRFADAELLARVEDAERLAPVVEGPGSEAGRGGMKSKIEAALVAARGGCHAVIASGREPGVLARVLAGEELGTWFPARAPFDARRRWIAFASAPRGVLHLDAGAVAALRRGASLLAAGVARIEGEFDRGDVVELRGPDGEPIGRGLAAWETGAARRWCAGTPPEGVRNHDALVHHRHIVLEEVPA